MAGLWPGLWPGGLESGFTSGLGPNLWNGILTANQCIGVCRMNWSKCTPNGLSTLARASLVYLTFSVLQEAVPAPVTNRNQLHELAFCEGWVRDREVSILYAWMFTTNLLVIMANISYLESCFSPVWSFSRNLLLRTLYGDNFPDAVQRDCCRASHWSVKMKRLFFLLSCCQGNLWVTQNDVPEEPFPVGNESRVPYHGHC